MEGKLTETLSFCLLFTGLPTLQLFFLAIGFCLPWQIERKTETHLFSFSLGYWLLHALRQTESKLTEAIVLLLAFRQLERKLTEPHFSYFFFVAAAHSCFSDKWLET